METSNESSKKEFEESDIEKVFILLKERFGFSLEGWQRRFKDYFLRHAPSNGSKVKYFIKFGNLHINPILNEILCRPEKYLTFNKILEFIVKNK